MKEVIEVKEHELELITIFLLKNRIILHPTISPDGIPDFSGFNDRKFNIILDRNILTKMIEFVTRGELKDSHFRKIVSSLIFWADFNHIGVVSSFALMEYSHFKQNSQDANKENKIFLEIFNNYHPRTWLNVALGNEQKIPKLESVSEQDADFFIESDHFKMHYLEMLKLAQLYFTPTISPVKKLEIFAKWVFNNLIICRYTSFYAIYLLFGKSKTFNNSEKKDFDSINQKCINQAWDLTYLSEWSTMHYYEDNADPIYLFATADKELKQIFINNHNESIQTYVKLYGKEKTKQIFEKLNPIYKEREMPKLDMNVIGELIEQEKLILKKKLKNYGL
ncbi:hypothetical protein [Sunxiuqinia elliptica]|uniref:Uncharacterized protein n=1 Tax=Sunxiuqinia elliptica TaxID=655355 RepID=A0A4R6GRC5_9BACT|nr:hypothetical protein [Sunxiuqinia elliptica]TDN97134.1 hypothetical protein DET52_11051 [Sunxiuqinia elliptica]TDO60681.1 hypothetical protein DET65_2493 [Sunxiuqinia elliptica]